MNGICNDTIDVFWMTSECGKVWAACHFSDIDIDIDRSTLTQTCGILSALPLEIWEMIFDFLPGQVLQLISKVKLSISSEIHGCSFICLSSSLNS